MVTVSGLVWMIGGFYLMSMPNVNLVAWGEVEAALKGCKFLVNIKVRTNSRIGWSINWILDSQFWDKSKWTCWITFSKQNQKMESKVQETLRKSFQFLTIESRWIWEMTSEKIEAYDGNFGPTDSREWNKTESWHDLIWQDSWAFTNDIRMIREKRGLLPLKEKLPRDKTRKPHDLTTEAPHRKRSRDPSWGLGALGRPM